VDLEDIAGRCGYIRAFAMKEYADFFFSDEIE
jgi:hypothetical protein